MNWELVFTENNIRRLAVGDWPKSLGGTPVSLMLYVRDVDSVAAKTVAAGASVLRPVQNQFYGDRSGTFADPFGHVWTVATHVEDLTPDEIGRRAKEAMQQKPA